MPQVSITGIEHVAINARNLGELRDWYVRTLDMRVVFDDGKTCFIRASDGSMIELLQVNAAEEKNGDKPYGLAHIAFSTPHFDETVECLKALKVQVDREPTANPRGKIFFFKDPEGNIVQLLQRYKPLE